MKIRLLVYLNQVTKSKDCSPIFERIIDWDNSLVFPFESTFKTMKCLYGKDCIVVIELI